MNYQKILILLASNACVLTHAKSLRFPLCGFGGFLLVEGSAPSPSEHMCSGTQGAPARYAMDYEVSELAALRKVLFRSLLRYYRFHIC